MSLIINNFLKRNLNPLNKKSTDLNQLLELSKYLCPLIQNQDVRYAGHSKWQNIRHTKASKDNIKAKLYNKLSLGITRAALKGTDPKLNKELSNLLDICRKSNVSKDLIERALKRAQEQRLKSIPRGFFGPNNVVGIASFLYDTRFTRPSTFLKPVFKTHKDFKFVELDKLSNFFERKGFIIINKYDKDLQPIVFEQIEEVAIESEAEEVAIECDEDKIIEPLVVKTEENNDKKNKKSKDQEISDEEDLDEFNPSKHWKLITEEDNLLNVKGSIEKNYPNLVIISHTIEYVAKEPVTLDDKQLEQFNKFCSDLMEVEEFEKIYTNVN